MRTRLVFWGQKDQSEKVLIGIRLNEEENNLDVYIFPENQTTEEFVTNMHQHWRLGADIELPEHTHIQRQLSISEPLLPAEYIVDREDILKRAQTEWHFIVLSAKLYQSYQSELEDLKEKVEKLGKFDSALWEELKGFWSKVQEQVREKNLFRDHANAVRDNTNLLFSKLKELRKELDHEFHEMSQKNLELFREKLDGVDKRIQEGLSLQPIFQELKDLQREFRNTRFIGDHRSTVWKQLDGLFKKVKEKKFGPGAIRKSNPLERVKRRYDGLIKAIEKMEKSIHRDRKDLEFQNERIEMTEGSLEAQIRVAKIKMIEERIRSKEEKLAEMHKTQVELDEKMEVLKRKENRRMEAEKIAEAKKAIKEKIATEIKEAERARVGDETVQKAAEVPTEKASLKDQPIAGFEDAVDTIKAIAYVIDDKVDDAIDKHAHTEEE
ncbi:MAG: hypothetical protein OEQ53_20270 [Saprospiraceae bacterium]|nr:hypothetical protein [Saprospiraceae bacterium]